MVNLAVKIGSLALRNPVMPGSGTFSAEFSRIIDLNRQVSRDASGVHTASMQPKDSMGTREIRRVQAQLACKVRQADKARTT